MFTIAFILSAILAAVGIPLTLGLAAGPLAVLFGPLLVLFGLFAL